MTQMYDLDHAAVSSMHMFVAVGAQIDGMKRIEEMAGQLAGTLREAKMSAELVNALDRLRDLASKAGAEASGYRESVERVQHASTAALAAANLGR